jgi:hypothetical protein
MEKKQTDIFKNEIVIREELNIAKIPIFLPSNTKQKSLIIKKKINDNENQIVMIGILEDAENGKQEVGCFDIVDYKVYLFLIQKYKELEDKTEDIKFSINEIINFLGLKQSGTNTNRIKTSLKRLAKIPVDFSTFFYKNKFDTQKKEYVFQIIKNLSLISKKNSKTINAQSSCKFDNFIINNLDFNYAKPTIFSQIRDFKNDYTLILHRYFDPIISSSKTNFFKRSWLQLAQDIQMPYKLNSKIQRYLIPALNELKEKKCFWTGFISDFVAEKNDLIIYFKKFEKELEYEEVVNNSKNLNENGFDINLLENLKKKFGNEKVEEVKNKILKRQNKIKNINAFLTSALNKNFTFDTTQEEILEENQKKEKILKTKKRTQENRRKELFIMEQQESDKIWEQFSNLSEKEKEHIKSQAISKIETDINKKFNQDSKIDKLFFNDLALKIKIIEILKSL